MTGFALPTAVNKFVLSAVVLVGTADIDKTSGS
jgi:hypothetical protein